MWAVSERFGGVHPDLSFKTDPEGKTEYTKYLVFCCRVQTAAWAVHGNLEFGV
jgi:hypothetical protein